MTNHAIERFVDRFPGDVPPGSGTVRERVIPRIHAEVAQALEAGRRCASEPRWLTSGKHGRRKASAGRRFGTCRYVWTPTRSRAYAITQKAGPDGVKRWSVRTTFWVQPDARLTPEQACAEGSHNWFGDRCGSCSARRPE